MAIVKTFIEGQNKEISNIPKTLYKYRTTSAQHLDILFKRQIFFSSADKFNDPFDCFIPIRFDLLTEDEFDEMSISIICKYSLLSKVEATSHYFQKVKGDPKFRQYSNRDEMMQWQLENLRKKVTVFCLSKENDNILLWSHYSANHTGICIGFDRDFLYYNTGASVGKVEYLDDYLTLKPTPVQEPTHIFQVLTKAKKWEYEMEYRFVYWENKFVFDIEPKSITELIFGCMTPQKEIEKITALLKSGSPLSHVKIFRAEKVPYTFKVMIKPIEMK